MIVVAVEGRIMNVEVSSSSPSSMGRRCLALAEDVAVCVVALDWLLLEVA